MLTEVLARWLSNTHSLHPVSQTSFFIKGNHPFHDAQGRMVVSKLDYLTTKHTL